MLHQGQNYSWTKPDNISDDDQFIDCNFMQDAPYTNVFGNKTGLKFFYCNLTNCDLPDDAEHELCNTAQVELEPE